MAVVKRRHPVREGPPANTAGPNRWIPKIRQARGFNPVPQSSVIKVAPPHQLQPNPTAVRPKKVNVVLNTYQNRGQVLNTKLQRNTVPTTVTRGKVRVIGNTFKREGIVKNVKWIKSTLPRVKGKSGIVIPSTFYRRGLVVKGSPKKPVVIPTAWPTWQDAINAGYDLYFEPGPNVAGSYTEIFDFGIIFNSILVNLDWNLKNQVGTVSVTSTISVSTDNITYDAPVAGTSRFATSARYVKVIVTFTPANKKSGLNFYNFKCVLSVHRETDAGSVAALSTDVSGTPVLFNKAFKAIDGLTLTPQVNTSLHAVYANLSTSGFNVYVFDDAGVRQSATVTWVARGIL